MRWGYSFSCALSIACGPASGGDIGSNAGNRGTDAAVDEAAGGGGAGGDSQDGVVGLRRGEGWVAGRVGRAGGELVVGQAVLNVPTDALTEVTENGVADFRGLRGITEVGGNLTIEGHPNVTSLAGFESLARVGGHMIADTNPLLAECEIAAFAASLAVTCECSGNGSQACQ